MSRMDTSTVFVPYHFQQMMDVYNSIYTSTTPISQPSSFIRSSAQRTSSPRLYYSQQQSYRRSPMDAYNDEGLSSSSGSSSSAAMNVQEQSQDYQEPNYTLTATGAANGFSVVDGSMPRSAVSWPKEELSSYSNLSPNFEPHFSNSRFPDAQLYGQSIFERQTAESQYSNSAPEMPPYYEQHSAQEQALAVYANGELHGRGGRLNELMCCRYAPSLHAQSAHGGAASWLARLDLHLWFSAHGILRGGSYPATIRSSTGRLSFAYGFAGPGLLQLARWVARL